MPDLGDLDICQNRLIVIIDTICIIDTDSPVLDLMAGCPYPLTILNSVQSRLNLVLALVSLLIPCLCLTLIFPVIAIQLFYVFMITAKLHTKFLHPGL